MTYPRAIRAFLYDKDGTTFISGALDESFGRTFMDEGNGYGTGTCSLAFADANVSELQRGRFVQIISGDGDLVVFTFKIEGAPRYGQIDVGEESVQIVTVSGRGWGCVWDEFQVYPDGGLGVAKVLDYSYRLFSFASRTFPNITGWGPAQEMYEYFEGVTRSPTPTRVVQVIDPGPDPDVDTDDIVKQYPAPIGFPWPNAPKNGNTFAPTPVYDPTYWVCADAAPDEQSIGFHFFRGSFTLEGEQEVKFTATGDNLFTVYLNGIPIIGEPSDTLIWMDWHEVSLTLPAGEYVVAAVVENISADVDYNPGGLLLAVIAMAIYPGDTATTETLSLLTSTAADLPDSFFAVSQFPGYTQGQILDVCSDEAQARNCIPQYIGGSFGELVDTNGEDWDSIDIETNSLYIPSFALRLGSTGTDVLNRLHAIGRLDWHFQAEDLELDAFSPPAWSTTPVATFTEGVNITGLERGEGKPYANWLLIQYDGGFTEQGDSVEEAAYGARVEGFLSTNAATEDEALTEGRVELQRTIAEATAAVLMSIEPTSAADCPYEGFGIFDYVTIPAVGGGTEDLQVLAITMEEDAEGNAAWRLELGQRWQTPEREVFDLLRALGGKTIGSVADHGVAKD